MRSGIIEDLELALGILKEVDEYTLMHFAASDYAVYEKADCTPVTEIDQGAEKLIRDLLKTHRPNDQIYGEEYGLEEQNSSARSAQTTMDLGKSNKLAEREEKKLGEERTQVSQSVDYWSEIDEKNLFQWRVRPPGRPRKTISDKKTDVSNRRWVIDPIDGTKNFVRGVPVWASLLALTVNEEVVLGVVSAPALKRRWWAGKGLGAWSQFDEQEPRPLKVSEVAKAEEMSVSYSSLSGWKDRGQLKSLLELFETAWRTRAYGDFWSYMMVAEGVVDVALEPELEVYDMAALVPIVEEAGGCFTSLDGENGCWGGNALATNGKLHQACLKVLNA